MKTIKKLKLLRIIVLSSMLLCALPETIQAQTIEWMYEIKEKEKTVPQFFWVDDQGNGYYNIRKENPDEPGDANYGGFLLMLDNEGKYKGTTYIRDCENVAKLLPFGKNKFITAGSNCSKISYNGETRLLNKRGKTLKEGAAFPGNYFASIPTEDGFTFFSKPTQRWAYTFISIGTVDPDLNISYDSVSLKSIEKKDLGIVNSYKDPVLAENGNWIIPMQYGRIHTQGKGISLDHGTVLGIKDSKIIWQYPKTLSKYNIQSISGYKDKVGVYMGMRGRKSDALFVLLNQDGKELHSFKIRPKTNYITDMILTDKHIIILGNYNIFWYDLEGNLVQSFDFKEHELSQARRMQLLDDGSVIFAGRKNENAVIIKLRLDNEQKEFETEAVAIEEEQALEAEIIALEKEYNEIAYSTIEDVSENMMSATVFPNPASSYINFEFELPLKSNETFIVQIFDQSSQLVISKAFAQHEYSLDIDFLPAGTYVYRITMKKAGSKVMTGQFVKIGL